MSTSEHRAKASGQSANCAILTVSDTRTTETDLGGQCIEQSLTQAGHQVGDYRIVKDEPVQVGEVLNVWLTTLKPDLICVTGGTGISSRDTTIEVVSRLLDKRLEGFGELFRMLSWEQVGPAAMLSRAIGGLAGDTLIFAMPGSVNAVGLAMSKLIVPELSHLVWERKR